jgi:hypothetical protein
VVARLPHSYRGHGIDGSLLDSDLSGSGKHGLKVCLVNSQHVKHVPGRKSDVSDCQWLQYLHTVGLLRGSFRPEDAICQVRSLPRHRDGLVEMAAEHVQHMQKALSEMKLQLHHVLSDLMGQSGMAILDAILAGERDPHVLAELRHGRVQAKLFAKLWWVTTAGKHLFTLRQSLQAYRHYQILIAACDQEIAEYLKEFDSRIDTEASFAQRDILTGGARTSFTLICAWSCIASWEWI